MVINEKKTKTMLFNFTSNYQFTTRLLLKNEPVEVIDSTRLLGTIISNDRYKVIAEFMRNNRLKLNDEKTHLLVMDTGQSRGRVQAAKLV